MTQFNYKKYSNKFQFNSYFFKYQRNVIYSNKVSKELILLLLSFWDLNLMAEFSVFRLPKWLHRFSY